MKSSKLLIVVIVLEALILLGQWTGSGPIRPVYGQALDAGAQREQMIEELKSLNSKMDKLIQTLEGGIQVKPAVADEKR